MTLHIKANIRSVYQSFCAAFVAIFQEMPNLDEKQALEMLTRLVEGKQVAENSLMAVAAGLYWHQAPQVLQELFSAPEPIVVAHAVALACSDKLSPRTLINYLCQQLPPSQESFARSLQLAYSLAEQGQSSSIAFRRLHTCPLAFGFYCFLMAPYITEWTMLLLKKYVSQNSHLMSLRSIAAIYNQDYAYHALGDWLYRRWAGSYGETPPIVTAPDFLGRRI